MSLLPNDVPLLFDVGLDVEPKGYKQVKNDGRTHAYKGKINEIQPDSGGSYAYLFSQVTTYAEGGSFEQRF